jgi:hypothetical protein
MSKIASFLKIVPFKNGLFLRVREPHSPDLLTSQKSGKTHCPVIYPGRGEEHHGSADPGRFFCRSLKLEQMCQKELSAAPRGIEPASFAIGKAGTEFRPANWLFRSQLSGGFTNDTLCLV